jgi:hypothetical protein
MQDENAIEAQHSPRFKTSAIAKNKPEVEERKDVLPCSNSPQLGHSIPYLLSFRLSLEPCRRDASSEDAKDQSCGTVQQHLKSTQFELQTPDRTAVDQLLLSRYPL